MSEFCKQCAKKHGMENDEPCFCEGCGKYVKRKNLILSKFKKKDMFWIVLIIAIFLFIAFAVHGSNQIKGNEKLITKKGFNISKEIETGKYIAGHPELDDSIENTIIFPKKDSLFIMKKDKASLLVEIKENAKITKESIKNILVEDQSTIEKRVTVGRLLLVGVFAFALKKKKKNETAFITIEWNDGKFDHETIFQFEGTNAMQIANKARNKIMRELNK